MTTFAEARIEPNWPGSQVYAGPGPAYMTHRGPVWMHRGPRNRVRFYDILGVQVGPEHLMESGNPEGVQLNVAPAVAYAHAHRWESIR